MGREKSDGRVVPKGRRKTDELSQRQRGKATTASEQVGQLELFSETADSPQGDVAGVGLGSGLVPATSAVPKSENTPSNFPPAMTIEEVARPGNLRRAWEQVASNDGAPGADRQSIGEVRSHLDEILSALHHQLRNGSYRPGLIRRAWIPKSGGGQRGLGIPNVIDRIVQQAVHQVLSPHFEPTFHASSHGFRPGRSCHTAIAEAKSYVEAGYGWVVDIDLENFFDRVHHDRLLARLGQRISDASLLQLIRRLLKAKVVMPNGVVMSVDEGTPQGGPLSPLLSNIVLDELDRELAERGHCFVRYADDCNIYVRSERAGLRVMAGVVRFIERRLRLKVNRTKSAVARPDSRHFVGFRITRNPETEDVEVLLSKRSKQRIDTKLRELTPRTWGRSVEDCIRQINAYLRGWIAFFWVCTAGAERIFGTLDAHIRRRLRAIALHHWKRKRTIARRLVAHGIRRHTAWRGVYRGRQGLWALSHHSAVDRALNKPYFRARGLVPLLMLWQQYRDRLAPRQLALPMDSCGC